MLKKVYFQRKIAGNRCDFFPFLENEGGNAQKNFWVKNGRELFFKSEPHKKNKIQCDHSIDSNIAPLDFDKMNAKFKIPAAYGVLESSQVLPIEKKFEFFWHFGKMKSDKIAVARSLCIELIRSRKETHPKIKF